MVGKFIMSLTLFSGLFAFGVQAESMVGISSADSLQTVKNSIGNTLTPKVYKEPKVKAKPELIELVPAENAECSLKDVELPIVRFSFNSVRIAPAERAKVSRIAQTLKERPDAALRIEGYADSRGSKAVNEQVSKARAEAVKESLVSQFGIDASRISAVGMGSDKEAAAGEARRAVSVFTRR